MANASILIVEDEVLIATDMKMSLIELGYSIAGIAASGMKAIELASKNNPDVIFMDIKIKGNIDGIETAKIIYEKLQKRVVFITAHADPATVERATECNPLAFISKPVEDFQFKDIIENALSH